MVNLSIQSELIRSCQACIVYKLSEWRMAKTGILHAIFRKVSVTASCLHRRKGFTETTFSFHYRRVKRATSSLNVCAKCVKNSSLSSYVG